MTSANELHVIFVSGPVGTALIELLLAQDKRVRVVTPAARPPGESLYRLRALPCRPQPLRAALQRPRHPTARAIRATMQWYRAA